MNKATWAELYRLKKLFGICVRNGCNEPTGGKSVCRIHMKTSNESRTRKRQRLASDNITRAEP